MDSYSTRANSIFCTFVTVLGTTAALNHLTSYLPQFQPDTRASVALHKVHDLTVNTYYNMDQCTLSFSANHDLTEEFHWNMNQLFVYLVAHYNDTTNKRNEVTLWDSVVVNQDQANFSAKSLMVEYPLRDQYKELRGREIDLVLKYRTMPITGIMYMKEAARSTFVAGEQYFRDDHTMEKQKRTAKKKQLH